MSSSRGAALAAALITALTCGIGAYVLLMIAMSQARQARFYQGRTSARYLAEAAIVIARERLWANPAYCGGSVSVDTDGDGAGDTPLTVTVTNCGAGNDHQLDVTAVY